MDKCIICQKEIFDYKPFFCCNGQDCTCHGLPTEPPLCSFKCGEVFFNWKNKKLGVTN